MRADRLIALLMLLQRRGQMSAQELAGELDVSLRTIYRDIDALCAAGIPICAEYGTNGGYRLVENYRTSLTGLTQAEINSLLLLTIPEPLASLEAGQKLKTALLKVYAALWTGPDETPARQPVYLDWAGWRQGGEPVPHLQTLYEAVCADQKVFIHYRLWQPLDIERVVEPYGLVAKAGIWYLVYAGDGRMRLHRVSEILEVQALAEHFERARDFDLERCWKALSHEREQGGRLFKTVVRVAPAMQPWFTRYLRENGISQPGVTEITGWTVYEVYFESLEMARPYLLGLGGAVEVIEPEALRLSLMDYARQIARLYQEEK